MSGGTMARLRARSWRGRRRLDALYDPPDRFYSLEAWQRYHHEDLAALSLEEIDDERVRLRMRLSFEMNPDPWLYERQRRLDEARARHRRR